MICIVRDEKPTTGFCLVLKVFVVHNFYKIVRKLNLETGMVLLVNTVSIGYSKNGLYRGCFPISQVSERWSKNVNFYN